MKKILNKKVLGVLLAVMMLFSLAAPAFATQDSVATITIIDNTDPYTPVIYGDGGWIDDALEVTVTSGMTVYDAIMEYDNDLFTDWHTDVWTLTDGTGHVTTYLDGQGNPIPVEYLRSLLGLDDTPALESEYPGPGYTTDWWNGYGLLYIDYEGTTPVLWHYVHCSYTWKYTVNGGEPEAIINYNNQNYTSQLTMDHCPIAAGDEIVLTYDLYVEPFVSDVALW